MLRLVKIIVLTLIVVTLYSCDNQNPKSEISSRKLVENSIKNKPKNIVEIDIKFSTVELENDLIYFHPLSFEKHSSERKQKSEEWTKLIESLMPDSLKLKTKDNPKGIPESELKNMWGDWGPTDEYTYLSNYIDSSFLKTDYYLICDSGIYSVQFVGTKCNVTYNLSRTEGTNFKLEAFYYHGNGIAKLGEKILDVQDTILQENYCSSAFIIQVPIGFNKNNFEISEVNKVEMDTSKIYNINIVDTDNKSYSFRTDNNYCELIGSFVFKHRNRPGKFLFIKTTGCDSTCECWFYLLEIKDSTLIKRKMHADQCDI